MAYVPRIPRHTVPFAEPHDGYAFGPVLLGALLGAGLGVILAVLMEEGLHFAAQGLNLSLPFGAWCAGALAGAVAGGVLSAWIGERTPTR